MSVRDGRHGECWVCHRVHRLRVNGAIVNHPFPWDRSRCVGGGRLPWGSGESYRGA